MSSEKILFKDWLYMQMEDKGVVGEIARDVKKIESFYPTFCKNLTVEDALRVLLEQYGMGFTGCSPGSRD